MVNLEAQEGPLQLKAAQIRSISSSFRVIRDRKKKIRAKNQKMGEKQKSEDKKTDF